MYAVHWHSSTAARKSNSGSTSCVGCADLLAGLGECAAPACKVAVELSGSITEDCPSERLRGVWLPPVQLCCATSSHKQTPRPPRSAVRAHRPRDQRDELVSLVCCCGGSTPIVAFSGRQELCVRCSAERLPGDAYCSKAERFIQSSRTGCKDTTRVSMSFCKCQDWTERFECMGCLLVLLHCPELRHGLLPTLT